MADQPPQETMPLHDFAVRSAERDAGAVALAMGGERLTYGELATLAGRLGRSLVEAGVGSGDRVCLLIPKHPLAVVAMHAVLEAGAIYVSLDPESPAARLARIVASAEPSLILAVPEAAGRLDEIAAELTLPPVWSVEEEPLAGDRVAAELARPDWDVPAVAPRARVEPSAPAHLIYTSGSTGRPKGVIVTHSSVAAAVAWGVGQFGTGPEDRVSCHAPLHFDQSTADVYATLAAGATVHLVPPSLGFNARALAALIRDEELTQWCSVPSALAFMTRFGAVEPGDFPALRRVLWGGDALPPAVLADWMRRLPHVSFTNLYGPTETTITSSFHTVPSIPDENGGPVPIGRACEGEEVFVLDAERRPVSPGEVGEIWIAGVGVNPGYWRDEERTEASFVPDPRAGHDGRVYRTGDLGHLDRDGLLHFRGRADSQVKSRGYRIELGEVEHALATVPGVAECAVVGLEVGGLEGIAICAAYVVEEGAEVQPRAGLAELVPGYMIPSRWKVLEVLPKNQNGKIDRPRLREEFERAAERRKERT